LIFCAASKVNPISLNLCFTVTGIPRPQERHFTIMVRFAQECQVALRKEVEGLAPKLGEQTLELGMRVGLHSGAVTAGVLRGEKARFQLFGDTMNVASRMESNGQKNRIHVSEDTANLLIRAGKGHWVTAREEKITAKGKGEMQTYWIEMKTESRSVTSRCSLTSMSISSAAGIQDGTGHNDGLDGDGVIAEITGEREDALQDKLSREEKEFEELRKRVGERLVL